MHNANDNQKNPADREIAVSTITSCFRMKRFCKNSSKNYQSRLCSIASKSSSTTTSLMKKKSAGSRIFRKNIPAESNISYIRRSFRSTSHGTAA